MEEILFSEAGSRSTKQKNLRLLQNSPPQIPILSLINLVQILTPHFLVQTNILTIIQ
jgi:hypothetical protein